MIETPVLLWTAVSIAGAVLAAIGVYEAAHDLRALALLVNGRRTVAFMHLRNQAGRLVINGTWVLLGFASLLDDRLTEWTPGVVILVAANLILTTNAALDLRARRRLLVTADDSHGVVAELTAVADERTEDIKQTIRDNAPERGQRGFRGDEGERGPRGHRGSNE